MQQVFLINGYGVPKSIDQDENYQLYLKLAFNAIFAKVAGIPSTVIVCGGLTDMYPPYRRTEAEEMHQVFLGLMKRPSTKSQTKSWKLLTENRSISTLENMLFAKKKLPKRLSGLSVVIIGEATRMTRMLKLARQVFDGAGRVQVLVVDFDQSEARYQDLNLIKKKEKMQLQHDLGALQSPAAYRSHHQFFVDKLAFFRSYPPSQTNLAIRKWWQNALSRV